MKHSSDKYNLAWFKLAECVSRGERERALGVYRLLAHSLDDRAVALQLEGDILLAFKDIPAAVERYRLAAQAYLQAEKLHHAASIYDHILMLQPTNHAYLLESVRIYRQLTSSVRLESAIDLLVCTIIATHQLHLIDDHAQELAEHPLLLSLLHERLFMAMLQHQWAANDAQEQLYKAIDVLLAHGDEEAITQCAARIHAASDAWYEKVLAYVTHQQSI